jgi:predicted enzyme related to lactoylglutathione lyase
MSLSIHQVAFDCKDARLQSDFWSQVLGYAKEDWGEYGAMAYSPDNTGVRVIFMPVPEQKSVKNRVHLDVRTADGAREAEVARLVKLGAKEIETKSASTDLWSATWTVMHDPEGNEFCVSGEPLT